MNAIHKNFLYETSSFVIPMITYSKITYMKIKHARKVDLALSFHHGNTIRVTGSGGIVSENKCKVR